MHRIYATNLYLFAKLFASREKREEKEQKKTATTAQMLAALLLAYHVFCSHGFCATDTRVNGAKMMEAILYFGRPTHVPTT